MNARPGPAEEGEFFFWGGEGGRKSRQRGGWGRGENSTFISSSDLHPCGKKRPQTLETQNQKRIHGQTSTVLQVVVTCECVVCLQNCYVLSIHDYSVRLILTYLLIMTFCLLTVWTWHMTQFHNISDAILQGSNAKKQRTTEQWRTSM